MIASVVEKLRSEDPSRTSSTTTIPNLSLRILRPDKEHEFLIGSRAQDNGCLRLCKSGEVVEVGVLAIAKMGIAIAQPLRRRSNEGNGVRSHRRHELFSMMFVYRLQQHARAITRPNCRDLRSIADLRVVVVVVFGAVDG